MQRPLHAHMQHTCAHTPLPMAAPLRGCRCAFGGSSPKACRITTRVSMGGEVCAKGPGFDRVLTAPSWLPRHCVFLRVDSKLTVGSMCRDSSPHTYMVPTGDPGVDGISFCPALKSASVSSNCSMSVTHTPSLSRPDTRTAAGQQQDSCRPVSSLHRLLWGPRGSWGVLIPHFLIKGRKEQGTAAPCQSPVIHHGAKTIREQRSVGAHLDQQHLLLFLKHTLCG